MKINIPNPFGKKAKNRSSESELKEKIQALMEIIKDEGICAAGYTSLDEDPTIMTACESIARLVGLVSWHLMSNGEHGDTRIKNELSRKIDINPCSFMTRQSFFASVAMNLLLYGDGNCVVRPHTEDGYLRDLEVIPASRVSFVPDVGYGYFILIDGIKYAPDELIHFRLTPDKRYPWKGRGIRVSIKDVADNLQQAATTEKAFMSSKYKPSLVVSVQAMGEEFQSKEGRDSIIEDYLATSEVGKPWVVPADQISVNQIKPLTLQDLAIADTVKLNKQTAAAIVGVPSFLVGVGSFDKDEFNNFITTRVREIVECIQQTLTKALILNPNWYVKGNLWALLDWDLQTIQSVYTAFGDRGWLTGNEARDRINLEPREGLDELLVLENYIPASESGNQKKLNGGNDDE